MQIEADFLLDKAMDSDYNEALVILGSYDCAKIGAGVRIDETDLEQYFIGIIVELLVKDACHLDLGEIEARIKLLRTLETKGFSICSSGNGSIYCEHEIAGKDIDRALQRARNWICQALNCEEEGCGEA